MEIAPARITPDVLNADIIHAHFFTAREGCVGADIEPSVYHESLGLLTICVLVLRNGFTVVGTSACVSAVTFNEKKGREIALENAKEQMWPLMGYALKQKIYEESL